MGGASKESKMQLHFLLMGAPVGIKNEASFFIYGDACWNEEGMQILKNPASFFQQKAPVGIENEASFFLLMGTPIGIKKECRFLKILLPIFSKRRQLESRMKLHLLLMGAC